MQSKIILLNGPIGCGKTEAVKRLKKEYAVVDRRCKDHLFTLTHEFFCMSEREFTQHYEDRATKEKPKEEFAVSTRAFNALAPHIGAVPMSHETFGSDLIKLSVREALIYVSEVICKPTFGSDYFGVARAKSIQPGDLAIDDSCGFDEEIPPTLSKLGTGNVLLIRIHGRGSFDGDSRRYIKDNVVPHTIDVHNTKDEESFLREITQRAKDFYSSGTIIS